MTNENSDAVADFTFDLTAYRADGTVVDRTSDVVFVLPGQTSVFQGIFSLDLSEAVRFTLEQVRTEWTPPPITGGITLTEARAGSGVVEVDLASTLSVPAEYTDVFLVAFVDDEIVGLCSRLEDMPAAGGTVTTRCALDPAYPEKPTALEDLPPDAEVDAFLAIDPLFGD
jgi:hypothetical protein